MADVNSSTSPTSPSAFPPTLPPPPPPIMTKIPWTQTACIPDNHSNLFMPSDHKILETDRIFKGEFYQR